jgi:uroporphyrinogen-III synthase
MSAAVLQGCNILVTRPEPDASRLAEKLRAEGAQAQVFATLKILTLFPKDFIALALQQSQGIFIFLSKHAVISVFQNIKELPQTNTVLAIGPGTAQELAKHHIKAIIPPKDYNTESLLNLRLLQEVEDRSIFIFAGEEGRTLLQETLDQRGAKVTVVPVYRRVLQTETPFSLPDWQDNGINIIITTSGDSLRALIHLTSPEQHLWLKQQKLLVISERMAEFAKELGFTSEQLIIAANASDQGIITALIENKKKFSV